MKRVSIAALLLLTMAVTAGAKKRETHPELCAIKTVMVNGISESATYVRRLIEFKQHTWLTLASSADKADAVFEIAESKSTRKLPLSFQSAEWTVVSGNLTRNGEMVWSSSAQSPQGMANSGAGTAAKMLLTYMSDYAGGCKQ